MSEQNVATVRAIWDAVNRGAIDEAFEHAPADFVIDWSASNAPESGIYRGRENAKRAFEATLEAWAEVEYFESEIIDHGDLVVRVGGVRAKGKGSGAEVTAEGAQVWTFREGTPVSVRLYQSKEEALEAVGHHQLIRDWADAFNRGDMDAALGLVHPEVELADPDRTGKTWRGHDEYLEFIREWLENFDSYRLELAEIEDGPDGTFVRVIQSGKGAGSGLEFELPTHFAVRFRDGKVAYYRIATEAEDARREVGLE